MCIEEIDSHIGEWESEKTLKYIFLIGEKGIGKSFCASYLLEKHQKNIQDLYIPSGKIFSSEKTGLTVTLLQYIIEEITKKLFKTIENKQLRSLLENIANIIKVEFSMPGVKIKVENLDDLFKPVFNYSKLKEEDLVSKFPNILSELLKGIEKIGKKGLFIVLDDIGKFAKDQNFANWLKSFKDDIEYNKGEDKNKEFPVLLMLIGHPEDKKSELEEILELFKIAQVTVFKKEEIIEYLNKLMGRELDEEVIDIICKYSEKIPKFVEVIGNKTLSNFSKNADGLRLINKTDAIKGVLSAAKEICSQKMGIITNQTYHQIFKKMVKDPRISYVLEDEIRLDEEEKRVFNGSLEKLKELKIIQESSENKAWFKLTDQSLEELKNEKIPRRIINLLDKLKNQLYMKDIEFIDALKKTMGEKDTETYKSLILNHAKNKYNFTKIIYPIYFWMQSWALDKEEKKVVEECEKIFKEGLDIALNNTNEITQDKFGRDLILEEITERQRRILKNSENGYCYDKYYYAEKYIGYLFSDFILDKCLKKKGKTKEEKYCPILILSQIPECIKYIENINIHEFVMYKAYLYSKKDANSGTCEKNYFEALNHINKCSSNYCKEFNDIWQKEIKDRFNIKDIGEFEKIKTAIKIKKIKSNLNNDIIDDYNRHFDKIDNFVEQFYNIFHKLTTQDSNENIGKDDIQNILNFFYIKNNNNNNKTYIANITNTHIIGMREFLLRCPIMEYAERNDINLQEKYGINIVNMDSDQSKVKVFFNPFFALF